MDKETFNKMPIEKQVEFINQELSKAKGLRVIQTETGIPRSTVQSRFKSNGYTLKDNQYIKETSVVQQEGKKEKEPKQMKLTSLEDVPTQEIFVSENEPSQKNESSIFSNDEIKVLKALIKKEQEGNDKAIILDLPSNKNTKTTIRVNADIWNDFLAFKKTSVHRQQDLISLAIKEFLDRYK